MNPSSSLLFKKHLRSSIAKVTAVMCALLISDGIISAQEVLHDYTQTVAGGGIAASNELGQIIILDQPAEITQVTFAAESGPVFGITSDIEVKLYAIHTGSPIPDEFLWSGVIEDAQLTRTITLFSIGVPDISVPRVFAFTIDAIDSDFSVLLNGGGIDANHFGNFDRGIYFFNNQWSFIGGLYPLAAKFEGFSTVPEPHSSLLMVSAFILVTTRESLSKWVGCTF